MKSVVAVSTVLAASLLVASPALAAEEAPTFTAEDAPEVLADELVVDLKDDVTETDVAEVARAAGIELRDNSPDIKDDGKIELAHVDASRMDAVRAALLRDPRVEGVEPLGMMRALWVPNDPKYTEQWHMSRVAAEKAWDYTCGEGVTVAVVDTGIACYDGQGFMKGTDLNGTSCVAGYNFVSKNDVAADDQGHGTHVAGTIAQTTNNGLGVAGLAHCAKLMPVKVLSGRGWGTMADVAEGIRWAADHGAQVINLSLGSSMRSGVVESAVKHAMKKGVVVVAAAGNSGKSVGYPAAHEGVIAVSATDRNDGLAWFSSRGPEVVIGAPGVAVTQQTICESGKNKCEVFGVFNGTSMASPHVAGAAALLISQGITHPAAVKAALTSSARPKEDKKLFGAGILDAGAAVSHTHWSHLGVRFAALLAFALVLVRTIKKAGGRFEAGFGTLVGAMLAGVGLVPVLPALGIPARLGAHRWIADLLMRPLGEWSLLLSPRVHAWLPLAGALPVFVLTAFFFTNKRLRPFVGGVALGSAALAAQLAFSGETAYVLGSLLRTVYLGASVVLCMFVARMTLDAKKA